VACLIQLLSSRIEYIEENYDYSSFIRANQEKDNQNIKYAIRRQGRVVKVLSYEDILLKRQVLENVILDSDQNILNIIEYFRRRQCYYEGECAGIIDYTGNIRYIMEYRSNRALFGLDRNRILYDFYDCERLQPDLSALENADIYVINGMNDYIWYIINLIIHHYPKKKIFISNVELMRAFGGNHQMRLIRSVTALRNQKRIQHRQEQGKVAMLISDNAHAAEYEGIYSSRYRTVDLIHAIYGRGMTERLKPNVKHTFVIYDLPTSYHGIGDILKFMLFEQLTLEMKGYLLVPYLYQTPNQYLMRPGENMCEYYFEHLTPYTVDQAFASGNFIMGTDSGISMFKGKSERWNRLWTAFESDKHNFLQNYRFAQRMRWKNEVIQYCHAIMPIEIQQGRRTLGVIARGTDYASKNAQMWHVTNADVETMMRKTAALMRKYHYDFVYLATEDAYYYDRFKSQFGNRLLATDQERINMQANRQYENTYISEIPKKVSGYQFGLNYIAVIYCLAHCNALLSSMDCGAYWLSRAQNENRYEASWLAINVPDNI